jgi:hypothetical protein
MKDNFLQRVAHVRSYARMHGYRHAASVFQDVRAYAIELISASLRMYLLQSSDRSVLLRRRGFVSVSRGIERGREFKESMQCALEPVLKVPRNPERTQNSGHG